MVEISDVREAAKRLSKVVHRTPINPSTVLSERTGAEVYLKLENLQRTGSFKIRGAYNKIATLSPEERRGGVVAASAGNHAQGVALAARLAGIPATIVMPAAAPLAKVEAVRGYGAHLVLHGKDYNEAEERAFRLADEKKATFVHAFNDPLVMAGQGTIALEILEDVPDVDTIVIPVGGGGLIAGIAAAAKALKPSVRVIGACASGAASLPLSLQKGSIVTLDRVGTIADGLATRRIGERPFAEIRSHVDATFVVEDNEIAAAILLLLERAKTVVEGAGAVGVAGLLAGKVSLRPGEKTVVLLSGGNIDVNLLDRVILRGLVETGRRLRVEAVLGDRPGALRALLAVVADAGANVEDIRHERSRLDVDLRNAVVTLDLDCKGHDHVREVMRAILEAGYAARAVDGPGDAKA
jgi:threonine dehydratase